MECHAQRRHVWWAIKPGGTGINLQNLWKPTKKGLVPWSVALFMAVFLGKEWQLLSWKMAKRELEGTMEASKTWMKQLEQVKADGRCVAQLLCPERHTKKFSCMSCSTVDLKIMYDPWLLLVCVCKWRGKIKTGLNAVPLMTMRVILRRKIMVREKSWLRENHKAQCWTLDECGCLKSLFSFGS